MNADDKTIQNVMDFLRREFSNKTERAEKLAHMMEYDSHLRRAVARQLVARQVPLKGTVG